MGLKTHIVAICLLGGNQSERTYQRQCWLAGDQSKFSQMMLHLTKRILNFGLAANV
jgi:hypothetical protein